MTISHTHHSADKSAEAQQAERAPYAQKKKKTLMSSLLRCVGDFNGCFVLFYIVLIINYITAICIGVVLFCFVLFCLFLGEFLGDKIFLFIFVGANTYII